MDELLSATERSKRLEGTLPSSSFDALTAHIAVVDHTGRIAAVNKAWRDFARANGADVERVCEGADYLEVCDKAQGQDAGQAQAFASGIRAVLSGRQSLFEMEYPCHSPEEKRWFHGRVTPLVAGDATWAVIAHENVTQRKEAQNALVESEIRYRTMVDASPDAIVVIRGGRIQYANPAALRLAGASSETELLDRDFMMFVHPDHAERVRNRAQEVLSKGYTEPVELSVTDLRGRAIHVEAAATRMPLGGEEVLQVVLRDLTERRRNERELLLKNMVFETSLAAGSIADTTTRITHVNPAFLRMWGYEDDSQAVGHPVAHFFADASRSVEVFNALNTWGSWEGDLVARRRDGSTFITHGLATTIRDQSGTLVGYQSTNLDITEVRRTAESLRFQSFLLSQIHDLVFGTDLQGRITYVNDAVCKLLQCPGESLLGRPLEVLGQVVDGKEGHEEVLDRTRSQGFWQGRLVHQAPGGERKVFNCRTRLLRDADGIPVGIVGVETDITERLAMEDHLRQIQKLESIGTLAGGIAHDFNNILTAILGYTELAIEESATQPSLLQLLGEVRSAGLRARSLISQILAFSRMGETTIAPVQFQIIIKEVLKLLRATLPSTIEVRRDIRSHGLVMADATQLHQVLMNLCTNAYHAMREKGGILTLRLSEFSLDQSPSAAYPDLPPGSYWKLEVSDTGIGMDEDTRARIFDPYFTTKEQGEGTGLGLAVAYGIVKSHRGGIYVESEPGLGSTFVVLLPRWDQEVQPAAPQAPHGIAPGHGRVLFVDDEVHLGRIASATLAQMGYQVKAFGSAAEALDYFRGHSEEVDLVITDLTMPRMTGDLLSEALKKIRPDIPVILCTGNKDQVTREHIEACGVDALVMKPWVRSELAEVIREVLERKHGT